MSKKPESNRVCCALITDDNDNILFGQRASGKYSNAGGHAEPNECAYSCIAREVKEEVGLDILDAKLIKVGKAKDKLIYVFKVTIDPSQKVDVSKDPDKEMVEGSVRYIDPNEIIDELHVPLEHNLVLQAWMEN